MQTPHRQQPLPGVAAFPLLIIDSEWNDVIQGPADSQSNQVEQAFAKGPGMLKTNPQSYQYPPEKHCSRGKVPIRLYGK